MRVVTLKGLITEPIKSEVNIVTTLVTKIKRQLLTDQIGLCLVSLTALEGVIYQS